MRGGTTCPENYVQYVPAESERSIGGATERREKISIHGIDAGECRDGECGSGEQLYALDIQCLQGDVKILAQILKEIRGRRGR